MTLIMGPTNVRNTVAISDVSEHDISLIPVEVIVRMNNCTTLSKAVIAYLIVAYMSHPASLKL